MTRHRMKVWTAKIWPLAVGLQAIKSCSTSWVCKARSCCITAWHYMCASHASKTLEYSQLSSPLYCTMAFRRGRQCRTCRREVGSQLATPNAPEHGHHTYTYVCRWTLVMMNNSISYRKYFVQLCLVLHHNDVGIAVLCNRLAGFGIVCCVDASCHTTAHIHVNYDLNMQTSVFVRCLLCKIKKKLLHANVATKSRHIINVTITWDNNGKQQESN